MALYQIILLRNAGLIKEIVSDNVAVEGSLFYGTYTVYDITQKGRDFYDSLDCSIEEQMAIVAKLRKDYRDDQITTNAKVSEG